MTGVSSDQGLLDPTDGSDPALDAFVTRAWLRALSADPDLPPGLYTLQVAFDYRVAQAEVEALHGTILEGSRSGAVDHALFEGLREQSAWRDAIPALDNGRRGMRTHLVLEVPATPHREPDGGGDIAAEFVRVVHGISLGSECAAGSHRLELEVAPDGPAWRIRILGAASGEIGRALLDGLARAGVLSEAPIEGSPTRVTLVLRTP